MSRPRLPEFVRILRGGNVIVFDSTDAALKDYLHNHLVYTERVFLHGPELYRARKAGRSPIHFQEWRCYELDHKGRVATAYGYLDRLRETLHQDGVETRVEVVEGHPRPEVFEPRWENLEGYALRPGQKEVLELMVRHDLGRIECPPGWGKTTVIGMACRIFYRARIAVATSRVEVLQQRIYPELCRMLPDVGIVGGGRRVKGCRVTCYTLASLHHCPDNVDLVIVDEGHEAGADSYAAKLARFHGARRWALSATWGLRTDSKDFRLEGLFGPVRYRISFAETEKLGLVVPVVVQTSHVPCRFGAFANHQDVELERYGVWRNEVRNRLIAADARMYGPEVQVLITVKTLEHALHLRRHLPEFELVYAAESQSPQDWRYYRRLGLIDDQFRILNEYRRAALRNAFERGECRKVIATPVWNVGVDMRHLQVIIRADASGSPIADVQIPGRGVRTCTVNGQSKQCAIVHDYLDEFDVRLANKARRRLRSYQSRGWTVLTPGKKDAQRLRDLAQWRSEQSA